MIDSGAVDTVMPLGIAKNFAITETEASKNGPGFRAANGSPIEHYVQRSIRGVGGRFQPLSLTAQVAKVKTTLGSVHQMLKAGNRVHFEPGNCNIEHISTGRMTRMEEKHGTFEVGIWVPSAPRGANCEHANCECANRVAAQSFPGQD